MAALVPITSGMEFPGLAVSQPHPVSISLFLSREQPFISLIAPGTSLSSTPGRFGLLVSHSALESFANLLVIHLERRDAQKQRRSEIHVLVHSLFLMTLWLQSFHLKRWPQLSELKKINKISTPKRSKRTFCWVAATAFVPSFRLFSLQLTWGQGRDGGHEERKDALFPQISFGFWVKVVSKMSFYHHGFNITPLSLSSLSSSLSSPLLWLQVTSRPPSGIKSLSPVLQTSPTLSCASASAVRSSIVSRRHWKRFSSTESGAVR